MTPQEKKDQEKMIQALKVLSEKLSKNKNFNNWVNKI